MQRVGSRNGCAPSPISTHPPLHAASRPRAARLHSVQLKTWSLIKLQAMGWAGNIAARSQPSWRGLLTHRVSNCLHALLLSAQDGRLYSLLKATVPTTSKTKETVILNQESRFLGRLACCRDETDISGRAAGQATCGHHRSERVYAAHECNENDSTGV